MVNPVVGGRKRYDERDAEGGELFYLSCPWFAGRFVVEMYERNH